MKLLVTGVLVTLSIAAGVTDESTTCIPCFEWEDCPGGYLSWCSCEHPCQQQSEDHQEDEPSLFDGGGTRVLFNDDAIVDEKVLGRRTTRLRHLVNEKSRGSERCQGDIPGTCVQGSKEILRFRNSASSKGQSKSGKKSSRDSSKSKSSKKSSFFKTCEFECCDDSDCPSTELCNSESHSCETDCTVSNDCDILYENDFEEPLRTITPLNGCPFLDKTPVNQNYGLESYLFNQGATTVETVLLQGSDLDVVDPSGRGGNYALGMLQNTEDDKLSLSFELEGRQYVEVNLDVTPRECQCISGFFGCSEENADATLRISLIDDPDGEVPLEPSIKNIELDAYTCNAPKGASDDKLNWTRCSGVMDAGSAERVAINFDATAGNYVVFDNLQIFAKD